MKQRQFERELAKRLRENKKLVERQFLPGLVFGLAAVVGRHMFYIVLVLSWVMAVVTIQVFANQVKWVNAMLLFLPQY